MRVLHVIPDYRLDEPQLAVLEFCRVARMRGVQVSVLALCGEGQAARQLLDEQMVSTQELVTEASGGLEMQILQESVDIVQTHTAGDFSRVMPAVLEADVRLVHAFHNCQLASREDFPAGRGFESQATWVNGIPGALRGSSVSEDLLSSIWDGVWSPPIEELDPERQRAQMGVDADTLLMGVASHKDVASTIELMMPVRRSLAELGIDSHVAVFGAAEDRDAPDGFTLVSSDDADLVERLEGLDLFVQLGDGDFCQLSLLSLARRVPVVLAGDQIVEPGRGGWTPLRFEPGDIEGLTRQVLRYAQDPEMLDVHRKLARDYVLVFRDSMSMVGAYARLYRKP